VCVCFSWLQPESYVDPRQTLVLMSDSLADSTTKTTFYCNVAVTLTIVTRDQYAVTASVPQLKVRMASWRQSVLCDTDVILVVQQIILRRFLPIIILVRFECSARGWIDNN